MYSILTIMTFATSAHWHLWTASATWDTKASSETPLRISSRRFQPSVFLFPCLESNKGHLGYLGGGWIGQKGGGYP